VSWQRHHCYNVASHNTTIATTLVRPTFVRFSLDDSFKFRPSNFRPSKDFRPSRDFCPTIVRLSSCIVILRPACVLRLVVFCFALGRLTLVILRFVILPWNVLCFVVLPLDVLHPDVMHFVILLLDVLRHVFLRHIILRFVVLRSAVVSPWRPAPYFFGVLPFHPTSIWLPFDLRLIFVQPSLNIHLTSIWRLFVTGHSQQHTIFFKLYVVLQFCS